MTNKELQKETAIQGEQQSVSNVMIFYELQKLNENLKNVSDAIWHLCQYGICTK